MKKLIERTLKRLAADALLKYKPKIIGVTGSMGKTSTKEAIFAVLSTKFSVRRNMKNYNNEIGVPLTILGEESGGRSPFRWLAILLRALKLNISNGKYPQILILEMGADKPGDIEYLMSFVNPNIGVITGIGEVPVHIEFFKSTAQVAREKSGLIKYLEDDDFAILNFDDKLVLDMASRTKGKILSYGFSDGVDVRATNYQMNIALDPALSGITFKIEFEGKVLPIRKEGIFGKHQVYPMLGACATGLALKMNLAEIAEGLRSYQPPKGRLQMIDGIKGTWILDDSYNASPASTIAALETLSKFEGRRHIAVLGDMLELGEFTESMHRLVGEKVAESADYFFAVGERMNFAAEAAQARGLKKNKIFWFDTSDGARLPLQNTIQKGDVILIKGSQGLRMEKIVEEIMAHPEKAGELLVRQEAKWKKR
jgi:UDP-N-acetylmuramoyl-tripeptide--D-alanyl-D-alanine ligase